MATTKNDPNHQGSRMFDVWTVYSHIIKAFRSLRQAMEAKSVGKSEGSCCKTFARILFSHVGLLVLVTIYAVLGAYLFIWLELKAEEERRENKRRVYDNMASSLSYIVNLFWYKNKQNLTVTEFHAMVRKNVKVFHDFVVQRASDSSLQYDGDKETWDYDWTFPKSLLHTVTTMAAIGYGHISPKTNSGRITCILYSVVGIPLLLVFLANIGEFLATSFRYIYSRLCCRWCRVRRRFTEMKKGKKVQKKSLWKDDVGEEKFMPTSKVQVPITVNLCVIFVYLLAGGVLFSWWEGWRQIQSVYFTFITLTTIGFGDLVPGNSFLDLSDGFMAAFKMVVTVAYCLFGMALLSMCINLMQEQLVLKTRLMLTELGIMEEEIDPMEKYKYTKSQRGTVLETDRDHDGNKRLSLLNINEGESTTRAPSSSAAYYRDNTRKTPPAKISVIREEGGM
ncbi:hypothetical protein Pcinc_017656 [Petrolisthes cinctipes]|uniref:Potassium channel domain-containing protein n=1 Tax=Petrolisthes cinctipes TaxID=88211 RepID=A0AAE1FQ73_PETCI|nr:hypothetical protein Pcinc_017656 [Petrolisthes cinctipes]